MLIRIKALGPNWTPHSDARTDMRQSACGAGVDDHVPGLEATTDIPPRQTRSPFGVAGRFSHIRLDRACAMVRGSISGLCSLAWAKGGAAADERHLFRNGAGQSR